MSKLKSKKDRQILSCSHLNERGNDSHRDDSDREHRPFKSKLLPTIVALVLVCALAVTAGCGGLGALGAAGCIGGCAGLIKDGKEALETIPWNIEPATDSEEQTTNGEANSGRPLDEESTAGSEESESETSSESGQASGGEIVIEYTEYDPSNFYDMCDELTRLASGTDSDAIIRQYEAILSEYKHIDENSTMLYLEYSCDPSDDYLSEQYQSDSSMSTACLDAALTAVKAVCDGPSADAFETYVGDTDFYEFSSYEPMTDEETEIDEKITSLVAEYYAYIEEGEEKGWSDAELNQKVGPVYLELVKLRNSYAQIHGYDNFADFADEQIYNRDFDAADVERFHSAVKQISARAYDLMYNSSAFASPYYIDIEMSNDELLDKLTSYGALISPLAAQSGQLLTERHLYNIGSGDERMSGAYTVTLEESGVPYIFASVEGASGFVTMTHEFGHFTEATINHNPNPLLYGLGALELCEIHSNGLQALYAHYYDDIYGEYANEMGAYVVMDLLSNVTEGCLFDEFQRMVYKHPEFTLDDINLLYRNLCEAYGSPTSADDYWWMYVSHNFESPMYYLSYAASGIVALQIWSQSQADFDKAVSTWESIVNAGSYDYGYMELLDNLDISTFDDAATVGVICDAALNYVEANSTYYGNNSISMPEINIPGGDDIESWLDDWLNGFGLGGIFD